MRHILHLIDLRKPFDRRVVLRVFGLLGTAVFLAACANHRPAPAKEMTTAPVAKKAATSKRPTARQHQKSAAVAEPAPSPKGSVPDAIEGRTISWISVRFVQQEDGVDEAKIRRYMSVREGQPYHSDAVDQDIKALYESGMVEDVRVLAEPDDEAISLIYEITPRGMLR